jgi:hypothetical protein
MENISFDSLAQFAFLSKMMTTVGLFRKEIFFDEKKHNEVFNKIMDIANDLETKIDILEQVFKEILNIEIDLSAYKIIHENEFNFDKMLCETISRYYKTKPVIRQKTLCLSEKDLNELNEKKQTKIEGINLFIINKKKVKK